MPQWLQDILFYNEGKPLIFTQLYFWGFFAVVMAVYSFIYKQKTQRNMFLLVVSLFFYYKTSGFFVVILIVSTAIDYFIGNAIYNSNSALRKKILVTISVIANLFILAYFKYAYFFALFLN